MEEHLEPLKGQIQSFILQGNGLQENYEQLRLKGRDLFILQYGKEGCFEKILHLEDEQYQKLVNLLTEEFADLEIDLYFGPFPSWVFYVETTEGENRIWRNTEVVLDSEGLSRKLRELLGEELDLFDGNPRYIEKLDFVFWENDREGNKIHVERCHILREKKQLTLSMQDEKKVIFLENIPWLLSDLENYLEEMESFSRLDMQHPLYKQFYTLKLLDNRGREIVQEGVYGEVNLEEANFSNFCQNLKDTLEVHDYAFLRSQNFERRYPLEGEESFVKVSFDESGRLWTYLAKEGCYEEGDFVVVPVGKEISFEIVRVEEVFYMRKEELDFSMSKLKKVIRKYDPNRVFSVK